MKSGVEEGEEGIIHVAYSSTLKIANNTYIPNKKKYQIKKTSATDLNLNRDINNVNNLSESKMNENETAHESKDNEKINESDQRELVSVLKKQANKMFDPSTQFLTSTYIGEIACCPQVWIANDDHSYNDNKLDNFRCLIPGTNTNERNYTALPRYVEKVIVAEAKNETNSNYDNDQKYGSKNDESLEIMNNKEAKNNIQNNEDDHDYRNRSNITTKYSDYDTNRK
jgi:hypothetical protein